MAVLLSYIAANVRRQRLKCGLTQNMLAGMAEIDPRFLQKVEGAQSNIGLRVLLQLADALGVPPSVLLRPATRPKLTRGRPRKDNPTEESPPPPKGPPRRPPIRDKRRT
jgi:transcriptional regulator with XRE-family HTH domain